MTPDLMPGVVAIPHGWWHGEDLAVVNRAGGANVNELASARLSDIEPLVGMTHLDGIPIRINPANATR